MDSFLAKIGWGRMRKKIKIIVPFRSYPTCNKKKIEKKFKKLKDNHCAFVSSQNRLEKAENVSK